MSNRTCVKFQCAVWLPAVGMAIALLAGGCCDNQKKQCASWDQRDPCPEFTAGANRPPTAKTLYSMAKILATQGKDCESEYVLVRIIREYPTFVPAYCEMAELRMRQNRIDDAMRTLQAGLMVDPKSSTLVNDLGMCYLMKGRYSEALAEFSRAAGLDPQNARYRSNMAVAAGLLGRYDESISLFSQVVPQGEAHYNLSVVCVTRKDYVRASEEYQRAVDNGFDPDKQDASPVPTTMPAK